MTEIRFGLDVPTSAADGADPIAEAGVAEDAGFDFVSASDHPCGTNPTFETWTILTAIAMRTTRIGIASRVLGVPYRRPAMVAKMAETLDRLSGGRLILGLGGGSSDHEFRAFGIGVPSPRDKVDGLHDAIRIAKGLWSERGFSYDGRIHHTDGADIEPKPDRSIPIWLGTYGERALRLTGRLADGWIPSFGYAPPDRVVEMRDRVLEAARDAGRGPDAITLAYNIPVHVGDLHDRDTGTVAGPPDAVAERLRELIALGFTTVNIQPVGPDRREQVRRLEQEVLPALRPV